MRHVCAFFHGEEEAYRILLPFVAEGFAAGERAIHIVPPHRHREHRARLRGRGIDVNAALVSGQLDLRSTVDTYLPDGRFDGERMLRSFTAMAEEKQGYPLSRIVCDMDWASGSRPGMADLIAFEARVNELWSRHDDVVICVYDAGKLSGDMVIDIMRTHPMVLIGDSLQENPFFVPPAQYISGDAGRHGASGGAP